jgi:hypothetical protein
MDDLNDFIQSNLSAIIKTAEETPERIDHRRNPEDAFKAHQSKAGSSKSQKKRDAAIANLNIQPAVCNCGREDGTHRYNCPIQRKAYRDRMAAKKLQKVS